MSAAKTHYTQPRIPNVPDFLRSMIVAQFKYDSATITSSSAHQPENAPGDLDLQGSDPANRCPAESHLVKV